MCVVLLSGGLDSCVLLGSLIKSGLEVLALSVNYGQRHKIELEHATAIAKHYGVKHFTLDLSAVAELISNSSQTNMSIDVPHGHWCAESMKATVVPNRNMVMMSIAAAWALTEGHPSIAIAAHGGDHTIYPDCRQEFMDAFLLAVKEGNWNAENFKVLRPFMSMTKKQIVAHGIRIGAPIALSYSCYEGKEIPCEKCAACVERFEALEGEQI